MVADENSLVFRACSRQLDLHPLPVVLSRNTHWSCCMKYSHTYQIFPPLLSLKKTQTFFKMWILLLARRDIWCESGCCQGSDRADETALKKYHYFVFFKRNWRALNRDEAAVKISKITFISYDVTIWTIIKMKPTWNYSWIPISCSSRATVNGHVLVLVTSDNCLQRYHYFVTILLHLFENVTEQFGVLAVLECLYCVSSLGQMGPDDRCLTVSTV